MSEFYYIKFPDIAQVSREMLKMKYDKFVDTFYAKYLSIKKWESVFGKYFTPFNTIKLKGNSRILCTKQT